MLPSTPNPVAPRLAITADLRRLCRSEGSVRTEAMLRDFSSWRIGGPADWLVTPGSVAEAIGLVRYLAERAIPWVVIGHTTNLLFADEGFRGVLLQFGNRMARMSMDGGRVAAEAGIWVPHFAAKVGNAGLTGAEHAIGIPGTLGGLICMNGGSMRRGIGDHLVSAHCITREGEEHHLTQGECDFRYRRSRIQEENWIVLEGTFEYPVGDRREIRTLMRKILRERRRKFPRKLPNCGSVFVSDPAMYAEFGPPGAVIERLGLKGMRSGDAEISPLHANFIVNHGHAMASDILALIRQIREKASATFSCNLHCEVRYVDEFGNVVSAHLSNANSMG